MNEDEYLEKSVQFAKGTMELAFRMGYATRDSEIARCKDCKWNTAVEWVHCAMVGGMFGRTTDNYCSRAERKEQ